MVKPIGKKFQQPDLSKMVAPSDGSLTLEFDGKVRFTISLESTQRILEEADKNAPTVGREKALENAMMQEIYRQNGVTKKR